MLFKCVSVRSGTCSVMAPGLASGPGHSGCRWLFDVGSCFEALSKHLKGAAGFTGSCVHQIWHGHNYTLRHQNPFLHMYKRMHSYWHSFFPLEVGYSKTHAEKYIWFTRLISWRERIYIFVISMPTTTGSHYISCTSKMTHLGYFWMYCSKATNKCFMCF